MKKTVCAIVIGFLGIWGLCFFPASAAYAEIISPTLTADTYVDRDRPDDNFGGENWLDCHYGITGTNPDGSRHYLIRQILLRFDESDLASIPETDVINSAILRMYLNTGEGNSHVYMDVGIINTDWDEDTITWSTLAQGILYPRNPRITVHVGEDSGWYEWDITSIVANWHSGLFENHGISLDIYLEAGTPIEDYSRIFYSKEGSSFRDAGLVVDYGETHPPTAVDLTITDYEITQAIQYLDDPTEPDNDVPMIAHKPTIIRCYVDIGAAAGPVFNVSGRLYKREGGVEESIPPLAPIVAVASPERGNHHHTLNFRPPTEWLEGSWDFYVVINPEGAVRENDDTNNRFPATDGTYHHVDFEADDRELDIAWLKVHYTWSGWTGNAWAGDRVAWPQTVNFLRTVYPVAPHRVNYFPWPGAGLGDWDADIDADPSALLGAIDDLLDTSSMDPKPDLLYGWIPDAAYSGRGRGYLPGSTAFGQDDSGPNMLYRIIFTHEHGHNLDQDGHGSLPDATLTGGEFGYDLMDVDPLGRVVMRWYTDAFGTSQDLIDYMRGGGPAPGILDGERAWVTPYTYMDIHNEMTTRGFVTGGVSGPYNGPDTIYVSGVIDQIGSGGLHPIYVFSSHVPDQPQDGNYNIELYDRDGKLLYRHVFDVHFYIDFMGKEVTRVPFSFFIPYFPETAKIVLQRGSDLYDSAERSTHSPVVTLLYPNGGEILSGQQNIQWKAEDLDMDRLTYILLYSPDGGKEWTTLATRLHDTALTVDMDTLAGSANALFRVMVSDGLLSDYDDSDAFFQVKRKKPQAFIIHPDKELIFAPDHPMLFVGQGYDPEDGKISAEALIWESDKDGFLGSGKTLEGKLSVGIHTMTLRARDSDGNEGTDTIIVHNLKGVVYRDNDGDGFGDPADTRIVFDIPEGYVGVGGDCDDKNDQTYPGAPDDVVNGIDNDCDILVDEDAAKWFQRPDMVYGVNLRSEIVEPLVADDWLCTDGDPVAMIQFWGSYLDQAGNHWEQGNPGSPTLSLPPSPGIKELKIRIYKNKGDSPYDHPGDLLREYTLLPAQIKEVYWSSIPHPLAQDNYWWEHKFYYLVRLPVPFLQDINTVYWLSIGAATADTQWMWGWETSEDQWNSNACLYWKTNEYWDEIRPGAWPIPDGYPYKAVNMAFMLTTLEETCPGDFDRNRDVDGADLVKFMVNSADLALKDFAADFGRNNCP